MLILDFLRPPEVSVPGPVTHSYRLLPEHSVFLTNTPFIRSEIPWPVFYQQLQTITSQVSSNNLIVIDASYDPIRWSDPVLEQRLGEVCEFFPNNKVVLLSGATRHYFNDFKNIIYYPWLLLGRYQPSPSMPRNKRIGCLNRQNSPHRVWLMYNLLTQNLLSLDKDIYSVSFVNIYDESGYSDIAGWLGKPPSFNEVLKQLPPKIATHPDNFPNDWSTNHPAWHTAIAIITETEPGNATMVTEKTVKGLMSQSCWTSYMDESGYRFLEDIGFLPRLFKHHASDTDIQPIIDICRTYDTESVAMDYYHSRKHLIEHNYHWIGGAAGSIETLAPWVDVYRPKFQQRLDNL